MSDIAESKGQRTLIISTAATAGVALLLAIVSAAFHFGIERNKVDQLEESVEQSVKDVKGLSSDFASIRVELSRLSKTNEPSTQSDDEDGTGAAALAPVLIGPPSAVVTFSNGGGWGAWSDPQYCPRGQVICGLKQRVEGRQGKDDDTAMNAIGFYCCPVVADRPSTEL